jgi:hypothetical protein
MIVLIAAAIVGSVASLAVLWPYGAIVAFASIPFSASACALVTGIILALAKTRAETKRPTGPKLVLNAA